MPWKLGMRGRGDPGSGWGEGRGEAGEGVEGGSSQATKWDRNNPILVFVSEWHTT